MKFEIATRGHGDVVDITEQVTKAVAASGVSTGLAVIYVAASTAAVTTMEHEDGLVNDLRRLFEKLAPEGADYEHHRRWGDRNGSAHLLSALIGPSVTLPVDAGRPVLGEWQQVVLIDLDERPRTRTLIVTVSAGK